jgi:Glycosyl transferase family 2
MSDPRISVVLASRGRAALLDESIRSLLGQAVEPDRIEVLVKIDEDDPGTHEYLVKTWPRMHSPVRWFVGPRGGGYLNLHVAYNMLAAEARGEWIFVWNDDSMVRTQGWDALIPEPWGPICLLNPARCWPDGKAPTRPDMCFPLVTRKAVAAMGHLSLNAHIDAWLNEVFEPFGARRDLPEVQVEHHAEKTQDQTRWDSEALHQEPIRLYGTPEGWAARAKDVETLRAWLREIEVHA